MTPRRSHCAPWLAVALCACGTSGAPRPVPRADAQAPPRAPGFADVRGWRVLRWTMSQDEALAALRGASIAFASDEAVGLFPAAPGAPHTGPLHGAREVQFVHITAHADDADAQIEFAAYQLRSVTVAHAAPTQPGAEAWATRLRGAYGPPASVAPTPDAPDGHAYSWANADTRLVLRVVPRPGAPGWLATETWSPATPPPPAW